MTKRFYIVKDCNSTDIGGASEGWRFSWKGDKEHAETTGRAKTATDMERRGDKNVQKVRAAI